MDFLNIKHYSIYMAKKLIIGKEVYEILAENMMKTETNARSLKGLVDKLCTPLVYDMVDNTKKKNYKINREYVESVLEKAE